MVYRPQHRDVSYKAGCLQHCSKARLPLLWPLTRPSSAKTFHKARPLFSRSASWAASTLLSTVVLRHSTAPSGSKQTVSMPLFSALSSDSRFNVINKASVRVASGDTGRFNSGQEVPVLGAVSYPSGAGQAVQDVQYRNSGVTFEVKPNVRDEVVDLKVRQQISDFVSTTTGVNNSPTLNKREAETSLSLQDGDVVLLGGLSQDKQSCSHSGLSFLPTFLQSKGGENFKSEILLVIQLQRLM